MKKILFFRNFIGFSEGHLKVQDYFDHSLKIDGYEPYRWFAEGELQKKRSPWLQQPRYLYSGSENWRPDLLFVAGMDWKDIPTYMMGLPKINLIQHVRHGNPKHPLYAFLKNYAIRICVSDQVASAILPAANGPVCTIPNGVEVLTKTVPYDERPWDLFICGIKNRKLAQLIEKVALTRGLKVYTNLNRIAQKDYLARLAQSKRAIFLPNRTEGFYLPVIEAMKLGVLTICPDIIGNRGVCLDRINCLVPKKYDLSSFIEALDQSLLLDNAGRKRIIEYGIETSYKHSLQREFYAFENLLNSIDLH